MTEEIRKIVRFEREWIVSEYDFDNPQDFDDNEAVIEKALEMYNEEGTIEDMYLVEDHAREVRLEDKSYTETLVIDLTKDIIEQISENGDLKNYDFLDRFYSATTPESRYKIYYENDNEELDLLDIDMSVVETPYQFIVQFAKNIVKEKVKNQLKQENKEEYLSELS